MLDKLKKVFMSVCTLTVLCFSLLFGVACNGNGGTTDSSTGNDADVPVVLSELALELDVDETFKLEVLNLPQGVVVEWKTQHSSIVSVSQDGTVKGLYPGETSVIAKIGETSLTCKVSVGITLNPVPVFVLDGLETTAGEYERTLIKGDAYDFAPVLRVGGEEVDVTITATSGDPTKVSISGYTATAVAITERTAITFSCEYESQTYEVACYITVKEI